MGYAAAPRVAFIVYGIHVFTAIIIIITIIIIIISIGNAKDRKKKHFGVPWQLVVAQRHNFTSCRKLKPSQVGS